MSAEDKRGQSKAEASSRSDDAEHPRPSASLAGQPSDRLRVSRGFVDGIPHNKALGMQVLEFNRAEAVFQLPYDLKLVGNPDTGVLHGGAITALLDACSGAAVFAALADWCPIATLDLRIDYLRAGDVGKPINCRAHCYRLTRNVAFTRAVAYHDDEADPIATSMGTFMLGTKAAAVKK